MSALLLRLAGPTQAWDSRRRASAAYDGRHGSHVGPVGLMPTYSAIIGLLGAALGRPRGSDPGVLATLDVLVRVDQPGRVRGDFHTTRRQGRSGRVVQGVVETVLDDAAFLVGIGAPTDVLDELDAALHRPAYPLSLGKREYPVTLPLVAGRSDLPIEDAVRSWPSIAADWYREQAHTPAIFGEPEAPVYRVRWAPRGEMCAIERL